MPPKPNILIIRKERKHIIDEKKQVIMGAPDLAIEILSPGSIRRDRMEKKDLYEQFGVAEFWIVAPNNKSVEVYSLQENRYKVFAFAAETGKVQSSVLDGFELEVAGIFSDSI